MKNNFFSMPVIVENKWCRLGISFALAGVLALVLFFVPLTVVTPHADSPHPAFDSFPLSVSLVQAAGGLTITKSAPEFIAQGGILTYTFRITNQTGSAITQADIIDPMADELECGGGTVPNNEDWSFWCSPSPRRAIFIFGPNAGTPILDGDTAELKYWSTVTEPLTNGHKIVNSGYVISYTNIAGAHSYGPPVTTTVLGPSWEITKTTTSSKLDPSQPFEYTITVYNRGGAASSGVFTVTDELPNDAYFRSQSSSPSANFSLVGSTLTWTSTNAVNAGGSAQFSFEITVTESLTDGWPIVNSIYNVSGGGVTTPTTSGDPITVTVDSPADLHITKTPSANPVTVGDQLVYTLTATNNGDGPALGVVVTDTLSNNVISDSAAILDGTGSITYGGNTINFGLDNIAAGNSVRMVITSSVTKILPSPATIINYYEASATNGDATSDSPNIVTVQPSTPTTLTVSVGSISLNICETTPVTAELVDEYKNPIAGQSITLRALNGPGVFLPSGLNPISGNTNSSGVFTSILRITGSTSPVTIRANTDGITGYRYSSDIAIGSTAIPTAITVTVSPPGVATGGNATVTAEVRDCRGLAVSGETVTFTVDSLATIAPPGTGITGGDGKASVTVTAGGSPGIATITGTVAGSLNDTDTLNIGVPNLDITKSATPSAGDVTAGDTITYTVIVKNTGAVAVTNVVITDALDSDVNFVSGSLAPGGTPPNNDNGTLTFSAVSLDVGNNLTATIVVAVNTSAVSGTVIANTATVGSDQTSDTDSNTIMHQVVEDTGKVFLPIILKNQGG